MCSGYLSCPWKIAFSLLICAKSPFYHLINVSGHFSVILQPWNYRKVEFTYISSTHETATKITRILQSFGPYLEFESFKSVKYPWCYEVSKVGTFFMAHPVFVYIFYVLKTIDDVLILLLALRRCHKTRVVLVLFDCQVDWLQAVASLLQLPVWAGNSLVLLSDNDN